VVTFAGAILAWTLIEPMRKAAAAAPDLAADGTARELTAA